MNVGGKGYRKVNLSNHVDGVYFYDAFIIAKKEKNIKVFSNRCTHAGCKINKELNGELLCACHGSSFNASTGRVTKGPAIKSLSLLEFELNESTGEINVKI